jgi:hypothetical protein
MVFFPSSDELGEYFSDVLALRVATCQRDFGLPRDEVPAVPSNGILNSLRGLPLWVNLIGSIGHVAIRSQSTYLYPSIVWERDGNRPVPLGPPRHRDKVDRWLELLDKARVLQPRQLLPRQFDGIQTVMLMHWHESNGEETLWSSQEQLDHNNAYTASFVMGHGVPERFYPIVRYWDRGHHHLIARENARRELSNRDITANANRQRVPSSPESTQANSPSHSEASPPSGGSQETIGGGESPAQTGT